ncbi:MAG: tyrosine-type recombinase/integrase [Planctomycetota bacterium]
MHREPVPALIENGGRNAQYAWDECFAIDNEHTRLAYESAARRFLEHCRAAGTRLNEVMPGQVNDYLRTLTNQRTGLPASNETKKLHLTAIRRLFDTLVLRHAVVLNPAASVRGPRISGNEGKTAAIPRDVIPQILSISDRPTIVELRDRAILGVLVYTAARRAAVANLHRRDYWTDGFQYYMRFAEKGGKTRDIPVRHDLQQWIAAYLEGIVEGGDAAPLFRQAVGRTNSLATTGMSPRNISDLVKRRLRDAGLPTASLTAHSFRVATITNLLENGTRLEDVQDLAGHADSRTTRCYDRSSRKVTRNVVERITF